MSRQHHLSCDCTKSELDLFAIPPTQTTINHGFWVDTHPVATLTDHTPIEFHMAGDGENYLDLANTFLYLKASICRVDGKDLGGDESPGPVNNWMHSLFDEVTVTIGDTVVSHASNAYPYRAYLENLLSLGEDAKLSQLSACLWAKDSSGLMDSMETDVVAGKPNAGLLRRSKMTAGGAAVEMVGRVHSDILLQERFLMSNVPVKIKLNRSRDSFSLMAKKDKTYKVKIHSAVMFFRSVKVSDSATSAQQKALTISPAKYPITRTILKYFSIAKGMTSYNYENLFRGQMPTRIIVGCVDTAAFNGDFGKNPFNFQHKNAVRVALYIADIKTPIKALTPEHPHHNVLSYMSVLTGTGKWGQNEGCGFSREEYAEGYCIYAWDLTADLSDGSGHFQLMKNSNIRLELQFGKPLDATTTVIVYSEFQNMIMIDADRNVTTNYTS